MASVVPHHYCCAAALSQPPSAHESNCPTAFRHRSSPPAKASRMKSRPPKVLQPLAGQPLLAHALASVSRPQPARRRSVVGHGMPRTCAAFRQRA